VRDEMHAIVCALGNIDTHLQGLVDLLDGQIERDRSASPVDYTLLRLAQSIQTDANEAWMRLDKLWLTTSPARFPVLATCADAKAMTAPVIEH
jgi:hypothetical protein